MQKVFAHKRLYQVGIDGMRLYLPKLEDEDTQARRVWSELRESLKDIDKILHYRDLLYISKLILTKLISRHHDKPIAGHFGIKKTKKLIDQRYY